MSLFIQNAKFVKGIDPVADAYESGPNSTDVVSLANYQQATWIIHEGVGTTGTATITVESCDDVTPSTTTAVAFRYKTVTSGDTESVLTTATSSGFTTTAGSSHIYLISVDASELSGTNQYARLKLTESVDDPVLAGVMCILTGPRFASDQQPTAIV